MRMTTQHEQPTFPTRLPLASPLRSSPVPTGEVSASSRTEGVFSSSSPNLTADLMDDLLDPASTPIQICKLHDLTLTQLESIITSPAFMHAAAQLKAITTARAAAIESNNHLQSQSLQRAIAHDAYLAAADLNQTRNPNQAATKARFLETARKANATLLPRPDGGGVRVIADGGGSPSLIASPGLHFGGAGEVSRSDGVGLPPSPILMGEGRGEGSQFSSQSFYNSSQSTLASPGLHFGGAGEVSASSRTEGVFIPPALPAAHAPGVLLKPKAQTTHKPINTKRTRHRGRVLGSDVMETTRLSAVAPCAEGSAEPEQGERTRSRDGRRGQAAEAVVRSSPAVGFEQRA